MTSCMLMGMGVREEGRGTQGNGTPPSLSIEAFWCYSFNGVNHSIQGMSCLVSVRTGSTVGQTPAGSAKGRLHAGCRGWAGSGSAQQRKCGAAPAPPAPSPPALPGHGGRGSAGSSRTPGAVAGTAGRAAPPPGPAARCAPAPLPARAGRWPTLHALRGTLLVAGGEGGEEGSGLGGGFERGRFWEALGTCPARWDRAKDRAGAGKRLPRGAPGRVAHV